MENSIESGVREGVRNIKNQRNHKILIKGFEELWPKEERERSTLNSKRVSKSKVKSMYWQCQFLGLQ